MDEELKVDENNKPVAGFVTDDSSELIRMARIDDATKGLKVMIVGGTGAGTVTDVSVVSANGFAGSVANSTTTPAITLSTTINSPVLAGNGTAISAATTTGSTSTVVLQTSPTLITPLLGTPTSGNLVNCTGYTIANVAGLGTGVATALAVNTGSAGAVVLFNGALGTPSSGTLTNCTGLPTIVVANEGTDTTCFPAFFTAATGELGPKTNANLTYNSNTGAFSIGTSAALTAGTIELGAASDTTLSRASAGQLSVEGVQVLTASNSVTVTGKSIVASQITTGTFGTGAYTMDTRLTVPQILNTPATISVSSNAGTVTRANRINNFTNSSAATMTITMSTTSATDGDMVIVVILDASAAAQTITWVNTENSTVSVPTTSNGSTTLPLTVGFKWNSATSKWRCIASA